MRITIIGGGPGGHTAAFHAAGRGCEVTLVEAASIGGVCLNRGCIPTKTLRASADALAMAGRLAEFGVTGMGAPGVDLGAVRRRKDGVIGILRGGLEKTCATLGIRLVRGRASVVDARTVNVRTEAGEERIDGDAVIIATGSEILELPGMAFDHVHVCSSDDALDLTEAPRRLVIVGGGVIGCELAGIWRAFGSTVTIVEGQDRLLPMPSVDKDVSALLAREMRRLKVGVLAGRTLRDVRVEDGVVRATVAASPFVDGAGVAEEPIEADMVLVTVGRRPSTDGLGLAEAGIATDARGWITVNDRLETSVPGIHAIGDILGPSHVMLAHVAAMEGLCVVDGLCGEPRAMRYDAVPSAIFTNPEIGEVGLSEQQARDAGHDVACHTTQMRVLGKAHAMGELPGFFKIVADAADGRILGIHIVGAHASDMVAEAGLALSAGLTVANVADTIHAHPTLAEGLFETAHALLGRIKASSNGEKR